MEEDDRPSKSGENQISKFKEGYRSIDKKLSISKGDSLPILVLKILGRILLIGVLILLSPFLILGLILAMVAAL